MPDPGYGPNGQRLEVGGRIAFEAQSPPLVFTAGDDRHGVYPLGIRVIPFIDQDDDESQPFVYLGGV